MRTIRPAVRLGVVAAMLGVGAGWAQMQPPAVPAVHRHIYPEVADGEHDVQAALAQARKEHKRVLIIFGGDWCGDCQVLDINLHDPANAQIVADHYLVTHVNIGHMDQNVELAHRYGVPLQRGVPAVSVVSGTGKVVYAQAEGDFADMRRMDPRSVTEFLNKWKG